jgi:hypothetical protein
MIGASAILDQCKLHPHFTGLVEGEPALVVLPLGLGALAGEGTAADKQSQQVITFNEKGVSYVLV